MGLALPITRDSRIKIEPIRGSRPAPALTNNRIRGATMATPRICSVDGCGKPMRKRGWCGAHYARFHRTGSPTGSVERRRLSEICVVDGCGAQAKAKDMCTRHYKRARRHGGATQGRAANGECFKWITEHVSHTGAECLKWPFGATSEDRLYGYATWPDGTQESACRIMCRLANGNPPQGQNIARHLCGKGHEGCINPRHLAWGSQTDNSADMVGHGTRLLGKRVGSAKLTDEQVFEIRSLRGIMPQSRIAELFGVSQPLICAIHNRKRWSWL